MLSPVLPDSGVAEPEPWEPLLGLAGAAVPPVFPVSLELEFESLPPHPAQATPEAAIANAARIVVPRFIWAHGSAIALRL
jgi:hypothetical protein